MFVLFIWNLHRTSFQVTVVTEKQKQLDYLELRITFITVELREIAAFKSNVSFDVILTSITMTGEIILRKSW